MTVTVPLYLRTGTHQGVDFRLGTNSWFGLPTTSLNRPGGVIPGYAGELAVTATATPSMQVQVSTGGLTVAGGSAGQGNYMMVNKTTELLTVEPAGGTTRTDMVVARIYDTDYNPAETPVKGVLEIVAGDVSIAGMSAVKLAEITVTAGAASIGSGQILDTRPFAVAAGGVHRCKSTSRPSPAYPGMHIYETDTDLQLVWSGVANDWRYKPFLPAFVALTRTAGSYQSINTAPNADQGVVKFNRIETHAPAGSLDITTSPGLGTDWTTIGIPSGMPGEYFVSASVPFYAPAGASNGGVQRSLQLRRNGVTIVDDRDSPITGSTLPTGLSVDTIMYLAAGDTLSLYAYHDAGNNLQMGYSAVLPRFVVKRLSGA
jgi:hypothetical protein